MKTYIKPTTLLWISIVAGINLISLFLIYKGINIGLEYNMLNASNILETGHLPDTAFYPPGLTFFLLPFAYFNIDSFVPFLIFLNISIFFLYRISTYLFPEKRWQLISVIFIFSNPYLIWTFLSSKDALLEFLFLCILFFLILKNTNVVFSKTIVLFLTLTCISLVTIRATSFYVLSILLIFILLTDKHSYKIFIPTTLLFFAFSLSLMSYNYVKFDSFQVATNGGVNLYIGNNPNYIHGHPNYDIDVFFEHEGHLNLKNTDFSNLSEGEKSALYTNSAMSFIKNDVSGFIYRTLAKSTWYFFSFEKIPRLSGNSYLSSDGTSIVLGQVQYTKSIIYMLYKFIFISLFILMISWWSFFGFNKEYFSLAIPFFAAWPILAVTFPDTRFNITYSSFFSLLLISYLRIFLLSRKSIMRFKHGQIEKFSLNYSRND